LSSKISSIPEDLKTFREKHNLTQTRLAVELGVSRSTVWRWETGRSKMPCIMPIALKGLRHVFASRKSARRRAERLRVMKKQNKQIERNKALDQLPSKIRSALNQSE
tara:strand:- start:34 stop:354 length:321 start_codon:yes stop_codon:yes gene_type:complete